MKNIDLIKKLQEENLQAEVRIELFTYGTTPLIVDNFAIEVDNDTNDIYLQTCDINEQEIKNKLLG